MGYFERIASRPDVSEGACTASKCRMNRYLSLALVLSLLQIGAVREAKPGPEVTRATLANGLRVVVVRDSLAPVVTTVVNYMVGSNEAPAGFPGMAHAQEHMMFRGSPGLSADQIGGNRRTDRRQLRRRHPADRHPVLLHRSRRRSRHRPSHRSHPHDASAGHAGEWEQERGAIEQEVAQDSRIPSTFSTPS